MPYAVEIQGVTVPCDTRDEVIALLPTVTHVPLVRTLREALATGIPRRRRGEPTLRKKPGPKPKGRATKAVGRPRTFKRAEPLTTEERAALASDVPALICRKPLGCGKAFQSENRKAWYCTPCTAKRDEGRAV